MHNFGSIAVAIATMTLATASAASAQTVVNFDNYLGRSFLDPGAVANANRLSDQLRLSGALFSSLSNFVALVDLGLNHATSDKNDIGGVTAQGNLSYAAPITISFWHPDVARSTRFVTNRVEIRGDLIPTGGNMFMKVFDSQGNLLSTVTAIDAGGTLLKYEGDGIHRLELSSADANVAFDDLLFNPLIASTTLTPLDPNEPINRVNSSTTVPEPSSLAMLGGGALMLGLVARRRRMIAANR